MKTLPAVWMMVCLSLTMAVPSHSGPLRDRFMDRMQQKSVGEVGDPAAMVPGSTVLTLSYGPDPVQTMDVYLPPAPQRAPILVMVHGGGWRLGDKTSPGVVENKLKHWLPQGFIVVSVNYRLLPKAKVETQAQDVARALAYIQNRAAGWGGDGDRVILMGHSAGAHLVALLSADPGQVTDQGGRRWTGTVVIDSAALDLVAIMERRHPKLYDDAFGRDPAYWRQMSPKEQLKADAVSMLVSCSTTRADDPCGNAEGFAARAEALNVAVDVLPQAMNHMEINRDLGLPGAYTDAVQAFIVGRLSVSPVR